jgi:hypothetical protein
VREYTDQELEDAVEIQRARWMEFVLEQVEAQKRKQAEALS